MLYRHWAAIPMMMPDENYKRKRAREKCSKTSQPTDKNPHKIAMVVLVWWILFWRLDC
jgi:hypothetical protein